jgi:hypothetical protein
MIPHSVHLVNPPIRVEVLVKEGINHPDVEDQINDEETKETITAWLHGSHLTDNNLLSDSINNVAVDIGKDKDWSISDYKEACQIAIPRQEHL